MSELTLTRRMQNVLDGAIARSRKTVCTVSVSVKGYAEFREIHRLASSVSAKSFFRSDATRYVGPMNEWIVEISNKW